MGLIQTIRGWFNMILKRKAKDEFNVEAISTDKMDAFIKKCVNIYKDNKFIVTFITTQKN